MHLERMDNLIDFFFAHIVYSRDTVEGVLQAQIETDTRSATRRTIPYSFEGLHYSSEAKTRLWNIQWDAVKLIIHIAVSNYIMTTSLSPASMG